jgi:hypothetical protein
MEAGTDAEAAPEPAAEPAPQAEVPPVIEIVPAPDPLLSQEADQMRAEVLPSQSRDEKSDDWDVPTFLRKQSD